MRRQVDITLFIPTHHHQHQQPVPPTSTHQLQREFAVPLDDHTRAEPSLQRSPLARVRQTPPKLVFAPRAIDLIVVGGRLSSKVIKEQRGATTTTLIRSHYQQHQHFVAEIAPRPPFPESPRIEPTSFAVTITTAASLKHLQPNKPAVGTVQGKCCVRRTLTAAHLI